MKNFVTFPVYIAVVTAMILMAGCDSNGQTRPEKPNNNPASEKTPGDSPYNQPQADDEELLGNADTTGAAAVIQLKGTTAEYTGGNVNIKSDVKYGTIIEITQKGTYVVQGTLNQGFIAVTANVRNDTVTVVLNGVNIFCKNYAAISSLKNSDVIIELADGSTNYLTDGGEGADADGRYSNDYDGEREPNAALLVRRKLTIRGSGSLIVNGNANNGIGCRANLIIESGNIFSSAVNNAIKGNDSITINGGNFTLVSQGDAIKTDEDSYLENDLGDITITGGSFDIVAVNDGIQAERGMTVSNALIKMKTGGGSNLQPYAASAKGLKALTDITIHSGTFDIDSNDDSIHSDGTITINGGTFTLSSADDAIRAETRLTINDGNINITKCYEGLESYDIDLNGGFVSIKASDDGFNIAGGKDTSTTNPGGGWQPVRPGQPGGGGGGGSQVISGTLTIRGGEYRVEASGDGIDSNGNIRMEGGTVVLYGPTSTNSPDVPLDYDGTFVMTGGLLVGLGNAGQMLQQPGTSSTQNSFLYRSSSTSIPAASLVNVSSSAGAEVVTVRTIGTTRSLMVCSPLLARGTSYRIYTGGSHSGKENELGLFEGGTYSGGTQLRQFTTSSTSATTTVQ